MPSKKHALEQAQAAHAETGAKIVKLQLSRQQALVGDDTDDAIAKLDREIDGLASKKKVQADRVAALEQQLAREAAEQRAAEQEAIIERIEAKLADRDAVGAELAASIRETVRLFRKLIGITEDAVSGWPFNFVDQNVGLLSGNAIRKAVQSELHSCGVSPFRGGHPGERIAPSFPGGQWFMELSGNLTELLERGSEHASWVMRGKLIEPADDVFEEAPPLVEVMLQGPTRSAAEIQASIPKVRLG
jgi:hypothetical protein